MWPAKKWQRQKRSRLLSDAATNSPDHLDRAPHAFGRQPINLRQAIANGQVKSAPAVNCHPRPAMLTREHSSSAGNGPKASLSDEQSPAEWLKRAHRAALFKPLLYPLSYGGVLAQPNRLSRLVFYPL